MNMGEGLMFIAGIVIVGIAIIVVVVVPLAQRNDDISQTIIQTAMEEFLDKAATKGQIEPTDLEEFEQKITASTGNIYKYEIIVQHLDKNPADKLVTTSGALVGNPTFSTYTQEILDYMYEDETKPIPYPLNKGDNVISSVENESKTWGETWGGQNAGTISASASRLVVRTGK